MSTSRPHTLVVSRLLQRPRGATARDLQSALLRHWGLQEVLEFREVLHFALATYCGIHHCLLHSRQHRAFPDCETEFSAKTAQTNPPIVSSKSCSFVLQGVRTFRTLDGKWSKAMLAHGAPTANSKPGNVVTVGILDRESVEKDFEREGPLPPKMY